MRRLLAVVLSCALAAPAYAGNVKAVPEIQTDLNPVGQAPNAGPQQTNLVPGVQLNLEPIVSPVSPEIAVMPAANAPEGALQPKANPETLQKIQTETIPQANDPAYGEQQVSAGKVQFDQAQAMPNSGVDAAPQFEGVDRRHAPRLEHAAPREAPEARGPPSASGDGASTQLLFEQLLDEAVKQGRVTPSLKQQLLTTVYTDPLTLLHNRVYLDSHAGALAKRYPMLATFKLDSLKEINDSYDHETGNKFMKAMAAVSEGVVGEEGVVVRRSPTGFAVFLDAPVSDARMAAEALRIAVSRKIGAPGKVVAGAPATAPGGTISLGVAELRKDEAPEKSFKEALAKAEDARQLAKEQGGGDRVAYFDDDEAHIGASAPSERNLALGGDSKLMDRRTLEEAVSAFKRARNAGAAKRLEDVDKKDVAQLMQERDSTAPKPAQVAEMLEQLKDPEVARAAFAVVYRDRLSNLLNRRYLFDHLDNLLNGYTSYMALDLDKFGDLNAALGEDKADLVIKELGALLDEGVKGRQALPLHLSGEEFVVLGGQRQLDPKALGEDLRLKVRGELGKRVAEKYGIMAPDGKPYEITVSIGIAPIRREAGSSDRKLELVTAMAESLLQRAKANGRDRVEFGAEGLTALLARVVRVDETARRAVAALFAPSSRPAPGSAFLDNSVKPRADVLAALKFNPASEPGTLLSDKEKGGSETWLVEPKGLPKRVVKISDMEAISNEAFIRGVIASFEIFNERLTSPKSVAYRRVWPMKPVLVQEHFEDAHKGWMDSRNLPLSHKVALALLSGTFGVHGFNPGAVLSAGFSRTTLVDFEMSRAAFEVSNGPLPIGAGSMHPWVAENYLNDFEDYRPGLEAWRAAFVKPQTQMEVRRLMRRAGIPETRIEKDLAVFASNLSILHKVLERDISAANRGFLGNAKRAGLTRIQAEGLSDVNKKAHESPRGGILRDLVRSMNGGRPAKTFALAAEEWRAFAAARPTGLGRDEMEAALAAAKTKAFAAPNGEGPYTVSEVREAMRTLESLLRARPS